MTMSSSTPTRPGGLRKSTDREAPARAPKRSLLFRDEFGPHRGRPFLRREPIIVAPVTDEDPVIAVLARRGAYLPL